MQDEKQVGELGFIPEGDRYENLFWGSQINTNRIDASLKIGYVFPELSYKSFGFQSVYSNHRQEAFAVLEIMILTIRVFIAIFYITRLLEY